MLYTIGRDLQLVALNSIAATNEHLYIAVKWRTARACVVNGLRHQRKDLTRSSSEHAVGSRVI